MTTIFPRRLEPGLVRAARAQVPHLNERFFCSRFEAKVPKRTEVPVFQFHCEVLAFHHLAVFVPLFCFTLLDTPKPVC